jgi:hypothetical protein
LEYRISGLEPKSQEHVEFDLLIQKVGKKTPMNLYQEARAELERVGMALSANAEIIKGTTLDGAFEHVTDFLQGTGKLGGVR